MSASNPIEKAADTAAALTEATAPVVAATPPTPAKPGSRRRLAMWVGGGAAALAVAGVGYKFLTPTPPRLVAQTEPPIVKPEEPKATKPEVPIREGYPAPISGGDELKLPDLPLPPKPGPRPAEAELTLPAFKAPPADDKKPPVPGGKAEPSLPDFKIPGDEKKPPMPGGGNDTAAPFTLPPLPDAPPSDRKPIEFRAPDPVPVVKAKDKTDGGPVLTIPNPVRLAGGQDVPPVPKPVDVPKVEPKIPEIPTIDLPPPPAAKGAELLTLPPTPATGPAPMAKVDAPPPMPPVTLPVPPKPNPDPVPPANSITIPPPPPAVEPVKPKAIHIDDPAPPKPDKKDEFLEDWHTREKGDTFTAISQVYYKSPDYGAALEAYNKERAKADGIVRVPPTWVLEEQFPGLTRAEPRKPVEARPASKGGMTFEPVSPAPIGSTRPAPPAAVTPARADEYKVTDPKGMTIREVAREVYGSADAWKRLYEQNPTIDPTVPIPSGTTLRVGR